MSGRQLPGSVLIHPAYAQPVIHRAQESQPCPAPVIQPVGLRDKSHSGKKCNPGKKKNPAEDAAPEQDHPAFACVDAGEPEENPHGHVVFSFHV